MATANTDVILKILPIIANGIDDNIITDFINKLPSRIKAYIIPIVKSDITDLKPLHSNATSNLPVGIFSIRPSLCTGIPNKFARLEDETAEIVWAGGAIRSIMGIGIANNKNNIGNFILFVNSHPYKYNIVPKIVTIRDNPERNFIVNIDAIPYNIIPIINNISPV